MYILNSRRTPKGGFGSLHSSLVQFTSTIPEFSPGRFYQKVQTTDVENHSTACLIGKFGKLRVLFKLL